MKIVCFGDSNTYGYDPVGAPEMRYPEDSRWVNLLAKYLRAGQCGSQAEDGRLAALGYRVSGVVNAGQNGREIPDNGWESAESVAMQLAAATEPGDLIIIMLGSNDILLSGRSAEQTAEKMRRFLGALKMEAPGREILLVGPVAMQEGYWVPDRWYIEESRKLVRLYEQLAEDMNDDESIHWADVRFADANEWGVELTGDGVHFTKKGHISFAEGLTKTLKLWYSKR